MIRPDQSYRGAVSSRLALVFLAGLFSLGIAVRGATVTWTGSAGTRLWNQPRNWSSGALPAAADEVVIPARSGIIEIRDGAHSVLRVTASDGLQISGGSLTLLNGESRIGGSFVLSDGASLTVRGTNAVVIATGTMVEWGGDLYADAGGILRLANVGRIRTGGATWRAQGAGSLIEATSVTNVSLATSSYLDLTALRGGKVVLHRLPEVRGPIRVNASDTATVDLSGLRGRWSSSGFGVRQSITARSGGEVLIPGVTEFDSGTIDIDSTTTVPTRQFVAFVNSRFYLHGGVAQFGSVTNIDGSEFYVYAGGVVALPGVTQVRPGSASWRAQDPGSLINASAIREVSFGTSDYLDLTAATDARIDLSGLSVPRGPLRATATGGGVVDLSGLKGSWSSEGFSYQQLLTANTKGQIKVGGVTSLERGSIDLDDVAAVPTAQLRSLTRASLTLRGLTGAFESLTTLNDTDISLLNGAILRLPGLTQLRIAAQTWRARDPGTLISAPALNDVTFVSAGYWDIDAGTGAAVELPRLTSIRGPLRVTASGNALVDLSSLRGRWTSEGFTYLQSVRATQGGAVRIGGITEFDRGSLETDSEDGLPIRQWTSITRSTLTLRNIPASFQSLTNLDDTDLIVSAGARLGLPALRQVRISAMSWRARDPGSLIDASSLTDLSFTPSGYCDIDASTLARIDLSGLTRISGAMRVSASGGGIVDLGGLTGLWTSSGFTYRQSLSVAGEGRILIPRVTGFDRGSISITGSGFLNTEQLSRITDTTISIDNATAPFDSLQQQDGTTFTFRNGGQAVFGSRPRIVEPPLGRRVPPGQNVELTVVASGDAPLLYQWRKNGQNLRNETSSVLRLTDFSAEHAGSYSVVVKNASGAIESIPVLVTPEIPALPANDAFAQRGRLTTSNGLGTASSASASLEPGEPRHAGKPGGRSIWLTWKAPESGRAVFSTVGSNFDTLLAVYVGNRVDGLTEVASDEDSGGFLSSMVEFNVTKDTDYQIAIDGFGGTGGTVVLGWFFLMGAAPLPRILEEPVGGTVPQGGNLTLSVAAEGSNLGYQWFFKGNPIPGANFPTLELRNSAPAQAGIYSVVVSTPGGLSVETPVALVEVVTEDSAAPAQDKLDDLFAGPPVRGAVLHGVSSSGFTPVFPGIPGSRETGNNGAQQSPEDPIILGELGGASLWMRFQAVTNGWMELSTEGSAIPTVLGVYTNQTDLQEIALAAPVSPETFSRVLFGAFAGQDYLVMIDGVNGAQGGIRLSYSLQLAPVSDPLVQMDQGILSIEQAVVPGRYELATGQDLNSFTPVLTTNVVGGLLRFIDANTVGRDRGFYRIQRVP